MGRQSDFIKNQINSNNPFTTQPNIGSITNPIKEDSFLDTAKAPVKISDYKKYIQPNREASAIPYDANLDYARALGQSNWEQAGNAVMRAIPNTFLEIVNQAAGTLDLEDYTNSDNEIGNWLSSWAVKQKSKVDQAFPIYQENPNEHLQVGDFAWWMENGSNLVQSATAFGLLGYATGGASAALATGVVKGATVAAKAARAAKSLKWLGSLGEAAQLSNEGKMAANALATVANSALLTRAEGYGIAVDVWNTVYNEELNKLVDNTDLTPEQKEEKAKTEASRKAENAMNFNMLNVALNLSSANLFLKAPKLTTEVLKRASLANTGKHIIKEGLQESAEELVNQAAQYGATDDDFSLDNLLEKTLNKEGAESALLGFLGGAMQTGITLSGRSLRNKKDVNGNKVSTNDLLEKRVVDQEEQNKKWKAMSDAQKMTSVTDAYLTLEEQGKLYEEYKNAKVNGDEIAEKEISEKILYKQAYNAFNTGTTDQLKRVYEDTKKLSEEQAIEKGLDPATYKENSVKALNLINTLEENFNSAQAYINSDQVYDNQAELYQRRRSTEDLKNIEQQYQEQLDEDLVDLNIDTTNSQDENGNFDLSKVKEVANLESYKNLREVQDVIKANETRKQELIKNHSKLISQEYQNKLRDRIKYSKSIQKKNIKTQDADVQSKAETDKKTTVVEEVKKKTGKVAEQVLSRVAKVKNKIKNTVAEETSDVITNEEGVPTSVKLPKSQKPIEDSINKTLSNPETSNLTKLMFIKRGKEALIKGNEPEELKAPLLATVDKVMQGLAKKIQEEGKKGTEQSPVDNKINELANLAENLSPVKAEDKNKDTDIQAERRAKINQMNNLMLDILGSMEDKGIDTSDFSEVGLYFKTTLGEERFIKLYRTIQGLFNTINGKVNPNVQSYEELFLDGEQSETLLKSNKVLRDAATPAYMFNLIEDNLKEEVRQKNAKVLKEEGYTVFNNEDIEENEPLKIEEGHNKIAHLDKNFKYTVTVDKTGRFNVLNFELGKEDLDKKLNQNTSPPILNFREINEGSKIRLIALDQLTYVENGVDVTVYKDGTVDRGDKITKENPALTAPIGIEYKGEILKGAYLHVPDWITNESVRGDVAEQKGKLIAIRQAVLDNPRGIVTTVTRRWNGHELIDSKGYVNKTADTMGKSTLAVGKNGVFYTSSKKSQALENFEAFSGRLYSLYPVNTGKTHASPLLTNLISENPEYIKSITEAVRLYIDNNPNDPKTIKLKGEMGIDLTSLEGLAEYLNHFINVPRNSRTTSKFDLYISEIEDKYPIIEYSNYTLNFSIGTNIGNTKTMLDRNVINNLNKTGTQEEINAREFAIDEVITKLEKVLNHNTRINPVISRLNKKYSLPLINEEEVTLVPYNSYNDFIKEHSLTNQYSYELPNGDTIYTVQSTIEFDTDSIIKPEINEEVAAEIKGDNENELNNNQDSDGIGFNPDDDLTIYEDNLAPKVITAKQQKTIKENTPDSLTMVGVPISLQEVITNHLYATIIKQSVKEGKKDSSKYIQEFRNKLEVIKQAYTDAIERGENKKANLRIVTNIIKNYPALVEITKDKLIKLNHLSLNEEVFDENAMNSEDYQEDSQNEFNKFLDDSTFREDYRLKIGKEVRNLFSYINKVNPDTFEPIKEVFGIEAIVPLETVLNDVTAITAYNNDQFENISKPDLDSMLTLLNEAAINKPYLYQVIRELKGADKQIQNMFVTAMSKSYSSHRLAYEKGDGLLGFVSSDSNNIISVIKQKWFSGLMASKLIKNSNNKLSINKTVLNVLKRKVERVAKEIKTQDTNFNDVEQIFDLLGVNLNRFTLEKIDTEGIWINGEQQRLVHLFNNSDGFIKLYIQTLENLVDEDLKDNHPFQNFSNLTQFAGQVAKISNHYYTHAFKDVRGRNYFAYVNNNFIIDRFKRFKDDILLKDRLSKQPFTSNSFMLDRIQEEGNLEYYKYNITDGKSTNEGGKKFPELSKSEQEKYKVNLFFSQNKIRSAKNVDAPYIINTFYPTTSDKSVIHEFTSIGYDYKRALVNGKPSDKYINDAYEYLVKPEILRILDAQKNPKKYDGKGTKEGSAMFIMFPELNTMKSLFLKDTRVLKDITIDKNAEIEIKDYLRDFIEKEVNKRVEKWKAYNMSEIVTETKVVNNKPINISQEVLKITGKNLIEEAYNYELNTLLANMGIFQLFTTDVANYWKSSHWKTLKNENGESYSNREEAIENYKLKDWIQEHKDTYENTGKRLAADSAPGEDITNSNKDYFTVAHVSDRIVSSKFQEYFNSILKKKNAKEYLTINSTDAQELTTLNEHLTLMVNLGEITEQQKEILLRKDNKDELTRDDFKKIFTSELVLNPMKLRYVENVWKDGVEKRVYIKSSSFPLIKQLTKGLDIDTVRELMQYNGIDRIVYDSAIKVGGNYETHSLFTEEGKIRKAEIIDDILQNSKIEDLPRSGHKRQQQMPYKPEKSTINNPTQLAALITSTVRQVQGFKYNDKTYTGKQIQDLINEKYSEIYKIKYENLREELEYDGVSGNINTEKLGEILKKEGLKRNYSLYDLEAFNTIDGNFAVPLWATGVSAKIQSMLNSIVNNRVRKHTPRGGSFILGSSAGFNPTATILEGENATDYINNTTGLILDESWLKDNPTKTLRPMREDKDGSILPAEVIAPFRIYNSEGDLLNLQDYVNPVTKLLDTSKIDSKVLEMLGFRIPTQGLESMSYIKIVGFLPENSGDLLLAPDEFVAQMGSDFDIDKLYSLMYNTVISKDKLIVRTEGKGINKLDNDILDLYMSILKHPDVQPQILKPLDYGDLKRLATEIDELLNTGDYTNGLTEDYQQFKYNNAKVGKDGVSAFSSSMRTLANFADTDIYWKNKKGAIFFSIGGERSTPLFNPYTQTKKLKSAVMKAFQSLSVDNEKEQGMHKLGVTSDTFSFIQAMAMSGFEEDIIVYTLNQPIIKRYLELLDKVKGGEIERYEVQNIITEEFPHSTDKNPDPYVTPFKFNTDISKAQLKEQIGKTGKDIDTEGQRVILALYQYLDNKGSELQNISTALNTFNKGIGKNIFYSVAKENQILELLNLEKTYNNIFSLIGDFISFSTKSPSSTMDSKKSSEYFRGWQEARTNKTQKEFIDKMIEDGFYPIDDVQNKVITTNKKGEEQIVTSYKNNIRFIRPTTISGMASVYGTMFNNKIWSEYFPYNNSNLLNTVDSLKSIKGLISSNLQSDSELNEAVFDSIKSYLTTKAINTYTDGDIETERNRLFIDDEKTGNKSIATILFELIRDGKLSNSFINRLDLDIRSGVLPSTIKYKANVVESLYEQEIYKTLNAMLSSKKELGTFNGINYTLGTLTQDMITIQLLSGGLQKSNQFMRYIPISYLKTIGFYDELTKNFSESFNKDAIIEQTLQHNPSLVFNNKLNKEIIDGTFELSEGGTIYIPSPTDGLKEKLYFSIANPESVKKYKLFKLVDVSSKKPYYKQISTLGYQDFLEYNFNKIEATSIIPNNNPVIEEQVRPVPNSKNSEKFYKISKELDTEDELTIPTPAEQPLTSKYSLESENVNTILEGIATKTKIKTNEWLAKFLLTHTNKIKNIRIIVDTNIAAVGSYNHNDKTIKINPDNFKNDKDFEDTFLEELIHSFTKKAILENKNGEVLRLKGFRNQAIKAIKKSLYKEGHSINEVEAMFDEVDRKVQAREPITEKEDLIYSVYDLEEFVGRMFRTKKLQELLNEEKAENGKSLWEVFLDGIIRFLNDIGLNIKKDSILDYSVRDILTLVHTAEPNSQVKEEIKKATAIPRTVEFLNEKFKLRNDKGQLRPIPNADKVAEVINRDIKGIKAEVITKEKNKSFKEGVDFVFEQNPELAKIGTQEQYSQYLDTIFPDSKVKDIVYRGKEDSKLLSIGDGIFGKGIYFSELKSLAKSFGKLNPAILNLKSPNREYYYNPDFKEKEGYKSVYNGIKLLNNEDGIVGLRKDFKGDITEYVVFEPEQIHILGSKQDIEGFKKFKESKSNNVDNTSNEVVIDRGYSWRGDLEKRPVYTKEGVNTMRTSNKEAEYAHFGNPFSASGYSGTIKMPSVEAAVQAYKNWLLNEQTPITKEQIITIGETNEVLRKNQIDGITELINVEYPVYKFAQEDLKNKQYEFAINLLKSKGYSLDESGYMFTKGGQKAQTIGNVKPQQRQWILEQINSGKLDNATLLYDGKLAARGQGTHADSLLEVIKELRNTNNYGKFVKLSYEENLSLAKVTSANIQPFKENIRRRIKSLEDTIDKAKGAKDWKTAYDLEIRKETLLSRAPIIADIKSLAPLITQGEQDMEELKEIFDRGASVKDIIYMKEITDYWTNLNQLLFTEDDMTSTLIPEFKEIETQATIFANRIQEEEERNINENLKKYGKQTNVEQIFQYYQDINAIAGNFLDISRFNNPILNNLLIQLKEANQNAVLDSKEMLDGLDEIEKKVRQALKNLGYKDSELFELYRQKDSKGRNTNHLVQRYNLDFLLTRGNFHRGMVTNDDNKSIYVNYLKWGKENLKQIKLDLLFPVNNKVDSVKRKEYINSLKKEMGEVHYNEFFNEQKKKIEIYKEKLEVWKDKIQEQYNVNSLSELLKIPTAKRALQTWVDHNSPYSLYKQMQKGDVELSKNHKYNNADFIVSIPSKNESYDTNFKKIEGNKDLLEFYNYYQRINKQLEALLPQKERLNLMYYGIPYLPQLANNAYRSKGYKSGLSPLKEGINRVTAPIKDAVAKTLTIPGEEIQDINPITNRPYRQLNINLTKNNKKEIETFLALKIVEYQETHNGEFPSDEIKKEWERDKIDELSQKQSFDLPAVLKMYAMATLTYSHKAKVEDYMKIIQNTFERQKEIRRNSKDEIITREDNSPDIKEPSSSFKNTKAALNYLERSFYGITKTNEGVTTDKFYTDEESKDIKKIDKAILKLETLYQSGAIDEDAYNVQIKTLDDLKDSIGGVKVWSKVGDGLLKWVQLKVMGWNFMSGIANVGFGVISNYMEAEGGLIYSRESLDRAYRLAGHSMLRNVSFNTVTTPTAKKIRALMDNWDVLKDASKELFTDPYGLHISDRFKFLETYNATQRGEYINQAPLMIALMLDKKFIHNGEEYNYWDAYKDNGKWDEAKFGPEPRKDVLRLLAKLDQTIKMNHGNYDPVSSLMIKDKFLGRAMSQFRGWMFEGIAQRVEKEKYDDLLDEYRKGRYISVYDVAKQEGGLKFATMVLKGLIRNATFGKVFKGSNFESIVGNGLKKVDAANMRKLMLEINMYLTLYGAYLLLKAAVSNLDDDDDEYLKYTLNLAINQGLRLKTDIIMYINPSEFKNLSRDFVPMTRLLDDILQWNSSVYGLITGEDEIKSGIYAGHSRFLRETSQLLPFTSQIYKNLSYTIDTFDKK